MSRHELAQLGEGPADVLLPPSLAAVGEEFPHTDVAADLRAGARRSETIDRRLGNIVRLQISRVKKNSSWGQEG